MLSEWAYVWRAGSGRGRKATHWHCIEDCYALTKPTVRKIRRVRYGTAVAQGLIEHDCMGPPDA